MSLEAHQEHGLLTQTRSYLNTVIQAVRLVAENYEKLGREVPDILDEQELQYIAEDLDKEIAAIDLRPARPDEPDDEV